MGKKSRRILLDSAYIFPFAVGKPIKLPKDENPPDELVDKYHKIFIEELIKLFDKYKGIYDVNGENAMLCIE